MESAGIVMLGLFGLIVLIVAVLNILDRCRTRKGRIQQYHGQDEITRTESNRLPGQDRWGTAPGKPKKPVLPPNELIREDVGPLTG